MDVYRHTVLFISQVFVDNRSVVSCGRNTQWIKLKLFNLICKSAKFDGDVIWMEKYREIITLNIFMQNVTTGSYNCTDAAKCMGKRNGK